MEETFESPSYFWSCITFAEDCPFFSDIDPKLYRFGLTVLCFYIGFVLVILNDVSFFWSLDGIHQQADYYINYVRTKVRRVQMDQRRLMSMQERTEKQLKRSRESKRMVTSLRSALAKDDPYIIERLTSDVTDLQNLGTTQTFSDLTSALDY